MRKSKLTKKLIVTIILFLLLAIYLLIPKWSKLLCYHLDNNVCSGSIGETKYSSYLECKISKFSTKSSSNNIMEWITTYSRCGLGCRTENNTDTIQCIIIIDGE